jgi:hypothetical protein
MGRQSEDTAKKPEAKQYQARSVLRTGERRGARKIGKSKNRETLEGGAGRLSRRKIAKTDPGTLSEIVRGHGEGGHPEE